MRFQQHRDASCHLDFFLQGKAPKEIHAILTETLACFLPGRAKDLSAPLHNEPTNEKLIGNLSYCPLSHCYMFRHYRVILRQPVINTLPSYTSISNAAVGNTT